MTRAVRLLTALALVGSGALMYAASWQRWEPVCRWGDFWSETCLLAQDGSPQLLNPEVPGVAPGMTWAGVSVLVMAVALLLMPWALTGRRPGPYTATALVVVVLLHVEVGIACVRSGLAGEPVPTYLGDFSLQLWLFVTPFVVGRLAWAGRGWTCAAGWVLVVGLPLPGLLLYGTGVDTNPWWEAVAGVFTALAGLCLVVAALRTPAVTEESGADVAAWQPALATT